MLHFNMQRSMLLDRLGSRICSVATTVYSGRSRGTRKQVTWMHMRPAYHMMFTVLSMCGL